MPAPSPPAGDSEQADEDQELLRRAIAMVRGPRGARPLRGLTDGLKTPAVVAGALRAAKTGRVVEVRHDPSCAAAYAAKDTRSGLVMLRHRDSARLRVMCERLGWHVVEDGTVPPPG
jgi:hypothetical protein